MSGSDQAAALEAFDQGFVIGLLVGEGSFGGDGNQPQVTLRMHIRHEALFKWLLTRFPRSRLYGPYHHGGRSYYQWMARGRALVEDLLPLLEDRLSAQLDAHAFNRFSAMKARYAPYIERERRRAGYLDTALGGAARGSHLPAPERPSAPGRGSASERASAPGSAPAPGRASASGAG